MWECQLPALHLLFPGSCTVMLEPQSSAAPWADNARCTPTMPAAPRPPLSAAFVWEEGAYRAKTFNFYIFPRPFEGSDKRFVCQARTHRRGHAGSAALNTVAASCHSCACISSRRVCPGRMLHATSLRSTLCPTLHPACMPRGVQLWPQLCIRPPQASSMAFLASCGFDFNKAIYDGVGYLTGEGGGTWATPSPARATD